MSEFVVFDVIEQILVRLDVIDLIRCKSVCKSWLSFISSNDFVNTHLIHSYKNDRNNHEFRHRRILMPTRSHICELRLYGYNTYHIVGSSNGLVCVSPKDSQIFKEITQPDQDHLLYQSSIYHLLGVFRDCLCIFSCCLPPCSKKWVLKNFTWELFTSDCEIKYDAIHYLNLKALQVCNQPNPRLFLRDGHDDINLSMARDYIDAHVFVPSLVSPHVNIIINGRPKHTKNNNSYAVTLRSLLFSQTIFKRKKRTKNINRSARVQILFLIRRRKLKTKKEGNESENKKKAEA